MSLNVLQLIQSACYETNIPAPSALAGSTNPANLQLLNLFYAVGRDLRRHTSWPQLKKRFVVRLESGRSLYQLPGDFYAGIGGTYWDQENQWEMLGPESDAMFNQRLYGYVTLENRTAFRVWGPDFNTSSGQGQFYVNPTPGEGQEDVELTFEYVSKNWIMPRSWAASTSYTSGNYVSCAGNIYTAGSTTTGGTVPPNMAYGAGQDGGVIWLAITVTAWMANTAYVAGSYVTNGGNLYICTVAGTSAASGGPTGTTENEDITDNTVTWQYEPVTTWAKVTEYSRGDYVKNAAGTKYYRSVTPVNNGQSASKSGTVEPTWTTTTVSDGAITWTFISAAYDTLVADTDFCVFDDELMIAGLRYKFSYARGIEYQNLQQEYERLKGVAVGRWNSGQVLRLAGTEIVPSGLNPNVPEGRFNL